MNTKIIRAFTVSYSLDLIENVIPELSKRYEVVLLTSPGPELDDVERRCCVRGIRVPMERRISLKHDFISLLNLIKTFRKEKPRMVHSMTPKAGLLCMMGAWIARVPVRVHTFTGLVFPTATGSKRRILMFTDWLTCACATHVIPEGKGVMADLRNNGITKKPMKVLGDGSVKGIDLKRFHGRRNADRNEKFTFLFVGRIVRDKGINELVEAFVKLNQKYVECRLVLVGPFEDDLDPISSKTRQMMASCPNIEVVGEKLGDELVDCYATADCFVFPSYREGFPNTVLEAGAMGLPCIVTDINGSREIIEEGRNGVIIPPQDSSALYQAMEHMLTDTDARERMAANARESIASRFDQDFVRQYLINYYDEIMANV